MCGRYTLISPVEAIQGLFEVPGTPASIDPRYNIAPTQQVAVVRESVVSGEREIVSLRWGLLPPFASDLAFGNRLINSRSETAATKPSFRRAFRRQRCIVVADGFFEWVSRGGAKRPHYFSLAKRQPFAMAGLWESWRPNEGATPVETFTILTCEANADVEPIHHRMPVILCESSIGSWLDRGETSPDSIQSLLQPLPVGKINCVEVSTHVNSPRNDDEHCLEPVEGLF